MASISTLQFKGTGHPVVIEDAPEVVAHVQTVLSHWPMIEPLPGDTPSRVVRHGRTYTVHSPWLDTPLERLTAVAAACGAVVDAAQSFLECHPDHLCLHSATYEVGGRLVVMTGTAHAGKSTLAARMAREDVLVYCDDMLPLRGGDNHGVALGLPPRPRLPLPPSRAMAAHVARHTAASDGKYCYLDTTNLAPHGRTAPIGIVILLDRRAEGPAGFAPASRPEALQHLLKRNMVRKGSMQDLADRLESVIAGVPCVRLYYSDMEDVAALLMRSFGHWPIDAAGLTANQPAPGAPLTQPQPASRSGHFPPDTKMVRAKAIAGKAIEDEIFLFDAGGASVYHLNALASAIWRLLETPHSVSEVAALLSELFPETRADTIRADIGALFADLDANGVIETVSGTR